MMNVWEHVEGSGAMTSKVSRFSDYALSVSLRGPNHKVSLVAL
jgi:hypothetical protein